MKTPQSPRISLTGKLIIVATVVSGLFGSILDRALVATPAWRDLGVRAWADFSRHADLRAGLVVYPIGAILCWALVFAAALSCRLDGSAPGQAGLPIYLAALGALGAIVTTVVAAPVMMHVGQLSDTDTAALHDAFETFTVWGVYVRGFCFAAIFVCLVWALVNYFRYQPALRMPRSHAELLPVTAAGQDADATIGTQP
ncbi:hypothetical protein KXD96_12920 [Mycobacterium sp. SMC-2]|uniref:hypothetical protein n=1 Tax=Mycobacterium sp. SMC-2 TaxID=2857058 RepID=UPI0021B3EA61|nr:hypothetical protein [Mycobacterium sp. SMC-2]UXA08888.1 hypothetical protein KXD96_12920 [Mycobacterium sp. SMC-2]